MHQEELGKGAQKHEERAKAAMNLHESTASANAHAVKAHAFKTHAVTAKPGPHYTSARQEQGKGRAGEAAANVASVTGAVKAVAAPSVGSEAGASSDETQHDKQMSMHQEPVKRGGKFNLYSTKRPLKAAAVTNATRAPTETHSVEPQRSSSRVKTLNSAKTHAKSKSSIQKQARHVQKIFGSVPGEKKFSVGNPFQ